MRIELVEIDSLYRIAEAIAKDPVLVCDELARTYGERAVGRGRSVEDRVFLDLLMLLYDYARRVPYGPSAQGADRATAKGRNSASFFRL